MLVKVNFSCKIVKSPFYYSGTIGIVRGKMEIWSQKLNSSYVNVKKSSAEKEINLLSYSTLQYVCIQDIFDLETRISYTSIFVSFSVIRSYLKSNSEQTSITLCASRNLPLHYVFASSADFLSIQPVPDHQCIPVCSAIYFQRSEFSYFLPFSFHSSCPN